MPDRHVNDNVDIVVLPDETGRTYEAAIVKKIQKAVKDKLLLTSEEPYHKVHVEVEHDADGRATTLIATMMRARTYTADIGKVKVDADYNIQ